MANCWSCKAPIRWARTERNKRIPLEPDPVRGGNLALTNETIDGDPVVRVLSAGSMEDALHDGARYVSHFAQCPNADAHRSPR